MAERALFGVYLNTQLVTCVIALLLTYAAHRVLVLTGAYRWISHQALFETSLFLLIWAAVLAVTRISVY